VLSRWADEEGAEVNTGRGKTEVMVVPPAAAKETTASAAATAAAAAKDVEGRFYVTQRDDDGGWQRAVIGVTQRYDYLGLTLTPELDMTSPLRERMASARWQAYCIRALPHGPRGLPPHVLSTVYQELVQPHMEYAAGVVGAGDGGNGGAVRQRPRRRQEAAHACDADGGSGLEASEGEGDREEEMEVAASQQSAADRGGRKGRRRPGRTPAASAVELQQTMGRHVLGLNAGPTDAVYNSLPIALTYSELRWMHQRTRWDMARLRLIGRVLSTAAPATAASARQATPAAHPTRCCAASRRRTTSMRARHRGGTGTRRRPRRWARPTRARRRGCSSGASSTSVATAQRGRRSKAAHQRQCG
jgi:hypothetical protein